MTGLAEFERWENEVFRIETDSVWIGGEEGLANNQGRQLANRTRYLKALVEALGTNKQDAAVTLAVLATLAGSADKIAYFTGANSAALTTFTAFARTLVAAADAAAVRSALGAVTQAEVDTAIAALVDSSPEALNTLNEFAAALGNDPNFATMMTNELASRVRYFKTGAALPVANIGPIWHDDYNSIMTWQSFTANDANYTGYASVLVGGLLIDTQPTPRAGYVRSGVTNLSRAAYAALRGWAMHNGIMVASGTWAAGTIAVKDNADGTTFTAFDVRGEFPRFWDDGRGVDSGRAIGTAQGGMFESHSHIGSGTLSAASGTNVAAMNSNGVETNAVQGPRSGTYGSETRPRNVAFLAAIKF